MLKLRLEQTAKETFDSIVFSNFKDSYEFLDFGKACRINCYQ